MVLHLVYLTVPYEQDYNGLIVLHNQDYSDLPFSFIVLPIQNNNVTMVFPLVLQNNIGLLFKLLCYMYIYKITSGLCYMA